MNIAEKEILIAENEAQIAENVPQVYWAGHSNGYYTGSQEGWSSGYAEAENTINQHLEEPITTINEYLAEPANPVSPHDRISYLDENIPKVYENGQKSELKRFWGAFQLNGNRDNYRTAFYDWYEEAYDPQYTIKSSRQNIDVFYYFNGRDTKVDIIITGATSRFFHSANELITIRKLIVDETVTYGNMFNGCDNLANVTFEGVIANDIDIHWSPLTRTSIESIVNHLSSTASGKTLTLNETAVNTAFGINVNDESTFPVGSDFYNLRHSKDNWAFNYLNV